MRQFLAWQYAGKTFLLPRLYQLMNTLSLTLFFTGCCALMQCALTAYVTRRRLQARVSLSDGGDDLLLRRIRAHGNFVETTPMALLLMALLEHGGFSSIGLIAFGSALLLGRILHASSLLTNCASWSRVSGMALTIAVISIEGACALWLSLKPIVLSI